MNIGPCDSSVWEEQERCDLACSEKKYASGKCVAVATVYYPRNKTDKNKITTTKKPRGDYCGCE